MDKETLRSVQLEQLEMLKQVKRICEKLNIKYFLAAGTLLGAIRHDGFIPWDDDLDIWMMRDEYECFLREAPALLDAPYFLQSWKSDRGYGIAAAKLRKNHTKYVEKASSKVKAHQGIFIDIFPMDAYPDEPEKREWQNKHFKLRRRCIMVKCGYRPWVMEPNARKRFIRRIAYAMLRIGSCFCSKEKLVRRYEEICTAFNEEDTEWLTNQTGSADYGAPPFPRVCFQKTQMHKFEDDYFSVPDQYELILNILYSSDWMTPPPEEARVGRHGVIQVEFE